MFLSLIDFNFFKNCKTRDVFSMYYIITWIFFFSLFLCAFNEQWVSLPDGNLKNTPVDKPDIRFYSHILCVTAKIAIRNAVF